ncbi:MAG: peptidoglycan bridge formation glycyltransferase FemA/FemB family protein, partial [Chloroflexi bacterium]|nr:peptidoglycan bridge formation glycyltransferase FemA/FemB family protein [Chloroflexota bacterium]
SNRKNAVIIARVLTPRVIHDHDQWNHAILRLPAAHILQSWEWGAFKAKYGWTPTRVLFLDQDTPRAAAQILRRPLPHTPFGVLYVPKGPLLDYSNSTLVTETLSALARIAREQRAIFIKIDPDLPLNTVHCSLLTVHWHLSREQIQFKNTVLLDLTPTEEQLLAAMKPKTRYNIRLAQKRGVRIIPGTRADLPLFYEMYAETSARDGFLIRQFPYYHDAWGAFLDAGRAQMLLARIGDETVAGLILFVFGDRAWYFYGASRNTHRDAMPNHLLQWEAIRWAQAHGCTVYDFWGAPDTLDENAPMYGVYRFKEGFGGKFTQHIGAYDFVVNRPLYFLYAVVRPWYLARLRKEQQDLTGLGDL